MTHVYVYIRFTDDLAEVKIFRSEWDARVYDLACSQTKEGTSYISKVELPEEST